MCTFQTYCGDYFLKYLQCYYLQVNMVNDSRHYWWWVNIDSGNGLAPSYYLKQFWLSSMMPYGIIRPQWVNILRLKQKNTLDLCDAEFMLEKNILVFPTISQEWDGTGVWNTTSWDCRASAAMILTGCYENILFFLGSEFQQFVTFQCWGMIWNTNIVSWFLRKKSKKYFMHRKIVQRYMS